MPQRFSFLLLYVCRDGVTNRTRMNWINAKCGFCFFFFLLFCAKVMQTVSDQHIFSHFFFVFNEHAVTLVTDIIGMCVRHLTEYHFSISLVFFFCQLFRRLILLFVSAKYLAHTAIHLRFSFLIYATAICLPLPQCPLHTLIFVFVLTENGCKIPWNKKIWKRQNELIKLRRMRRSAKLQMRCRRRPIDSLFAWWTDELLHACSILVEFFISLWNLGMGSRLADGSQRDTYFIWIININLIRIPKNGWIYLNRKTFYHVFLWHNQLFYFVFDVTKSTFAHTAHTHTRSEKPVCILTFEIVCICEPIIIISHNHQSTNVFFLRSMLFLVKAEFRCSSSMWLIRSGFFLTSLDLDLQMAR